MYNNNELIIRNIPSNDDINNIKEIVESTGFFYEYEINVAVELVEERLKNGISSGYEFVFIEINGKTIAYACFGSTPCTKYSFDLYWIAVHNKYRNYGLGKKIILEVENSIKNMNGKNIYIETSSREKYIPTQKFYESCNYYLEAVLKNFYDENDDKFIYSKNL